MAFGFLENGFLEKSQAKNIHFYKFIYKFIYEFIYKII